MKQPHLAPGLTWFVTRSELRAAGVDRREINLHWLSRNPPHATPLVAEWGPPEERMTGPIDLWVGAVLAERRMAMRDDERRAVLTQLRDWIKLAFSASSVWQSQKHRVTWSVDRAGTQLSVHDNLHPGEHQE